MTVRPIRIIGDPVLDGFGVPVTSFDSSLTELVTDLVDTMHAAPGVGLAANQIGVALRVFVYDWVDSEQTRHAGVAVNPQLLISPTPVGRGDEDTELEGCLSLPGERFPLARAEDAILRAVDPAGVPFEIRASGWLARIFQHEVDHLDGVLYIDRLHHAHDRAVAKVVRKRGWGKPDLSWLPGTDELEPVR